MDDTLLRLGQLLSGGKGADQYAAREQSKPALRNVQRLPFKCGLLVDVDDEVVMIRENCIGTDVDSEHLGQ